jgi:DNA mismatch endonuclease (patch repair protein)
MRVPYAKKQAPLAARIENSRDPLSLEDRFRLMSKVRAVDTEPEIRVRRLVHALGYRFRLHRRDLPGTPDIVLPRLNKIVMVHGCFWHRHDCARSRTPVAHKEY